MGKRRRECCLGTDSTQRLPSCETRDGCSRTRESYLVAAFTATAVVPVLAFGALGKETQEKIPHLFHLPPKESRGEPVPMFARTQGEA
jgi:hypothetical protein